MERKEGAGFPFHWKRQTLYLNTSPLNTIVLCRSKLKLPCSGNTGLIKHLYLYTGGYPSGSKNFNSAYTQTCSPSDTYSRMKSNVISGKKLAMPHNANPVLAVLSLLCSKTLST